MLVRRSSFVVTQEMSRAIKKEWTKQEVLEILKITRDAFDDKDYEKMFREIRKAI